MPVWPLPPLFRGAWKDLTLGESVAVLARLSTAQSQAGLEPTAISAIAQRTRAVPLSFYPNWLLVETEWRLGDKDIGLSTFLMGPGLRIAPLAFSTLPLLQINRTELAPLDPEVTGPAYLRFFISLTANDGARFIPVEAADALPQVPAKGKRGWRHAIGPIELSRSEGGKLVGTANVLLRDALASAKFSIDDGIVHLIEDERIAVVTPAAEAIDGPFRMVVPADARSRQ